MSRKDYEAIAAIIADLKRPYTNTAEARHVLNMMAVRLAFLFAADNPSFDKGRFLGACDAPVTDKL